MGRKESSGDEFEAQRAREGSGRSVGARVESIIETAERAAAGIRQDAEERARSYLEESRRRADEIAAGRVQEVSELTEALIERARAIAKQSDELIAALEEAGRGVMARIRSGSEESLRWEPVGEPRTPPPPRPPPSRYPPPPPPPSPPPPYHAGQPPYASGFDERAWQIAAQMAVAGRPREEIARRLYDELGIRNPNGILDKIGL